MGASHIQIVTLKKDLIQHYLVFEARMAKPRLGIDLEDKFASKDA